MRKALPWRVAIAAVAAVAVMAVPAVKGTTDMKSNPSATRAVDMVIQAMAVEAEAGMMTTIMTSVASVFCGE